MRGIGEAVGWLGGSRPGVARLRSRKLGVTFPLAWVARKPDGRSTAVAGVSPAAKILEHPGRVHAGGLEASARAVRVAESQAATAILVHRRVISFPILSKH